MSEKSILDLVKENAKLVIRCKTCGVDLQRIGLQNLEEVITKPEPFLRIVSENHRANGHNVVELIEDSSNQ